jgi:predicted phosphoadenosine phosphosulfate sulfurtransferase
MPRRRLEENVFDAALERLTALYADGHRIVVSFSAGKDSGVCLELVILAARSTDRLPVEVVMRDEEVMYPGTFEYAERVACRPEVEFHWLVAHQPIVNVFDRVSPYFWTFDPLLSPEE